MGEASQRTSVYLAGGATQARVIGALIMRELHTRFGRDNIGYLWFILEPGLLGAGVAAMHFIIGVHLPGNLDIAPFYITGYSAYMMFRSNVNRAASTIEPNRGLLYHKQVTLFDLIFARCLLEAAATTVAMFLLIMGVAALGLGEPPARPFLIILGMLLMFWLTLGLAMLICAAGELSTVVDRIVHPTTYLILPVSGAFFLVEWLPYRLQGVVKWITLPQIVELVRMGQFGQLSGDLVNMPYIIAVNVVLSLVGLLALKAVRPKLEL